MRLCDLKDKHRGQRCFILGAGPSLRCVDEKQLRGITFTVNSSILKLPNPDYWLSDDQDTANWSYFQREVYNSRCVKLMDSMRLGRVCGDFRPNVVRYVHQRWYDWYDPRAKKYFPDKLSLTRDPERPLAGTRTSVATAIHAAWIMGCDPIVLLGCDCKYEGNRRYFWQYPGWNPPTRAGRDLYPNRVFRDQSNRYTLDTHCAEMIVFWRAFSRALSHRGVRVIDATDGGLIDAFPKVRLAELS